MDGWKGPGGGVSWGWLSGELVAVAEKKRTNGWLCGECLERLVALEYVRTLPLSPLLPACCYLPLLPSHHVYAHLCHSPFRGKATCQCAYATQASSMKQGVVWGFQHRQGGEKEGESWSRTEDSQLEKCLHACCKWA